MTEPTYDELRAERDQLQRHLDVALQDLSVAVRQLARIRDLHTLNGHGPGWAGTEPIDADAWCEGCVGLDDDGRCPTTAILDDPAGQLHNEAYGLTEEWRRVIIALVKAAGGEATITEGEVHTGSADLLAWRSPDTHTYGLRVRDGALPQLGGRQRCRTP